MVSVVKGENSQNTQNSQHSQHSQEINAEARVKKVRENLDRIKPFQLQFVQQVYTDNELDIEESGEILFKDEHHLKWTYLKPNFKVFILQDDHYKFYDEENEQITIGKIKDHGQQWLWQLFFSEDFLRYSYTKGSEKKKIFIKKESTEEPLDIEISLNNDYLPVQVIQQDPNTNTRMIFYFKDYKEKIIIAGDAFELNVPKNVEIIEESE